jgi:hypothetical protein
VGKRNDENFSHFNYLLLLLFFLNFSMGYRLWGSIWGEICPILLLFFSEFVCGLLLVCGLFFSQIFFFFLNCSCLIKFGPFKLLIFYG